MLSTYSGLLSRYYIFTEHISYSDIGNALMFFTYLVTKRNVLFDSHSRDMNGCFTDQGSSVTLSFEALIDVDQYIKTETFMKQFGLQRGCHYTELFNLVPKATLPFYKRTWPARPEGKIALGSSMRIVLFSCLFFVFLDINFPFAGNFH